MRLAEFDRREGWGGGFRSCAHWLSWRTGIDLGAAREKVRVARALEQLPHISAALARGELSYAKARAVTRVATNESEMPLLEIARTGTAAHVEQVVRAWRRIDRKEEAWQERERHRARNLWLHADEDGMFEIRGRLSPEVGALLVRALDAAVQALYHRAPISAAPTSTQSSVPPMGSNVPMQSALSLSALSPISRATAWCRVRRTWSRKSAALARRSRNE